MAEFKLNYEGVHDLLRSPQMMAVCREYAQQIADEAGDDYVLSEYTGENRVNVSVGAASKKALQDNYDNNTLLKSLGGSHD